MALDFVNSPLTQHETIATTITYNYDKLCRLTAADYASGEFFHYTCYAVGNRLTQELCIAPSNCVTTTYTYDNANRLATVNGVVYTFDANGNLLIDGTSTYT